MSTHPARSRQALSGALKAAAVCTVAAFVLPSPAPGQSTDGPGVTLAVAPQRLVTGQSVRISGTGYAQPGLLATIVVTPPGNSANAAAAATAVTVQVKPDAEGHFSTAYSATNVAGAYGVSARLGNGVPASATFTVQPMGQLTEDVPQKQKQLTTDIGALVDTTATAVENLPDSPARTQALTRLKGLQAQTRKLPEQSAKLASALQSYRQLVSAHPQTAPQVQPLFDKLGAWDEQAQHADDQVKKEIEQSRQQGQRCDTIDHTIEALKFLSAALNLAAKPFDILRNFGNDSLSSKAGSMASNPAAQFAASETAKVGLVVAAGIEGPAALFGLAAGLVVDAVTQIEQVAFDRYCQKFSGPFSARMEARFFAKNYYPNPWWTYTIDISGILTLRYPKESSGRAVALTGQFEGAATRFTYHEYVWENSDLIKLAAGGKVARKDTAPVAVAPMGYEGSLAGALSSPTSFYVPVTGQFANGKITFELEPARSDFLPEYTQGHTFYAVWSNYTLGIPIPGHFTLPYKDAHWVLDHHEFSYPVIESASSLQITSHDVQTKPVGTNNWAQYTIDLHACNPGC